MYERNEHWQQLIEIDSTVGIIQFDVSFLSFWLSSFWHMISRFFASPRFSQQTTPSLSRSSFHTLDTIVNRATAAVKQRSQHIQLAIPQEEEESEQEMEVITNAPQQLTQHQLDKIQRNRPPTRNKFFLSHI